MWHTCCVCERLSLAGAGFVKSGFVSITFMWSKGGIQSWQGVTFLDYIILSIVCKACEYLVHILFAFVCELTMICVVIIVLILLLVLSMFVLIPLCIAIVAESGKLFPNDMLVLTKDHLDCFVHACV